MARAAVKGIVESVRTALAAGLLLSASLVVIGTTASTAGASTSEQPIVVGDICSCTGPEASSVGQTSPTIQAWASWENAHGGIDGHKVDVIVKDDGYNPGTALSDATQLVSSDHVVAIFDNSDVDTSWASYIQQQKVPGIGGLDTAAGYTNPDFFPPGGTYQYETTVGVQITKAAGVKKEADLYCVEVAICAQSSAQLKTSLAKAGLQLVYSAGIGFAAPNYTAQCLAAKQSGATAMTVADASAIVAKVASECAAQGYTPTQFSADGSVSISWLTTPGMEGNIDSEPDVPWFVHDAATKTFYAALDKYAPSVATSPNFGEIALSTWAAGIELQDAVQAGNVGATPTAAEITDGLYHLPAGTTLGGLSPPIHFVKGQIASSPCDYTMGIKNQKFVLLDSGKLTCAK
jgi:branched-chain amino acid transport system substrate-binding protein